MKIEESKLIYMQASSQNLILYLVLGFNYCLKE